MALIMTNGMFGTSWAFYVGLTALGCGGLVTQGVALGWDMAAPLALNVRGDSSSVRVGYMGSPEYSFLGGGLFF